MRDPHVEEVHYDIGTGEGLSFANPPPMVVTNHLGRFELADDKLTIYPIDHYADGTHARAVLDPFLRAWELDADLARNIGSVRFKYTGVKKIDRAPDTANGHTLSVAADTVLVMGGEVSFHVTQSAYPSAPSDFRTTPEVEIAYNRWRAFREGREPLPSMAYAVLTLLESIAGSRKHAAVTFQIDERILRAIGELSSTKGDSATSRKFSKGRSVQPLTGSEAVWLETAIRRVVRRMGEHAAGAALSFLSMGDLPPL